MNDLFEQQLRDAARRAPAPDAPPDLIQRVIAARAAGERIILPAEPALPRRSNSRLIGGFAVAASLAGAAVLFLPTVFHRATTTPTSSDGFFVSTALAEQTSNEPTAPPLVGLTGL